MRYALICFAVLSCGPNEWEGWCDNGKQQQCVKPIASHGDCTVYRLYDRWRIRYQDFMRCTGSPVVQVEER